MGTLKNIRLTQLVIFSIFSIFFFVSTDSVFAETVTGSSKSNPHQVAILGDILFVGPEGCSTTPKNATAGTKLQYFQNGAWVSAGKAVVKKATKDCTTKLRSFGIYFQWEVDRLGVENPNHVSGMLRMRTVIPGLTSSYFTVAVYETKQDALDTAVQGMSDAMDMYFCGLQSGTKHWDSQQRACLNN